MEWILRIYTGAMTEIHSLQTPTSVGISFGDFPVHVFGSFVSGP